MKTQVQTALLSGVVALAGWVVAVDPATAAVYRGRFDPLYGDPFDTPPLAWNGSLTMEVDNNCIQSNTTVTCVTGGGIQITEVNIDIFQTELDPLDPTKCKVDGNGACVLAENMTKIPLNFSSSGLSGFSWQLEYGANQQLLGAKSTAFTAFQPNAGALTDWNGDADGGQAWFSLQFIGRYAQLYWFDKEPSAGELFTLTNELLPGDRCRTEETYIAPPFNFGFIRYGGNTCGWSDPDGFRDSNGALIQFSLVPEPTTFALVPAALAIMGMVGLRTRRRRSAPLPQ